MLVVAMHFGMQHTRCAYSFESEYKKNPRNVLNLNFIQSRQKSSWQSDKLPNCILFTPGAEFHSFGEEAEEAYAGLCNANPRAAKSWFYFERFKMIPRTKALSRATMHLDHTKKKGICALDVLSASIGHVKGYMMKILTERQVPIGPHEITWVVTVPPCSDDCHRQFVREAAQKAGIPVKQLVLALEHEAASVYCLEHYRSSQTLSQPFRLASPGKKFMLVDCGDDTMAVSMFELQNDSSLKQIGRTVEEQGLTSGIIKAIQSTLDSANVRKVDAILLAGELSESDVIQEAVKEAFPRDQVLVAPSPSYAVLTGAVMFGHNPGVIATRVSTYTYGVAVESHFREGSPGRVTTGRDEDQKEFHIHIQKEQEVKLNSLLSDCKVWPVRDGQVGMTFHLYRSTKKEPRNVDEEGCEKVGSLRVLTPDAPQASKRLVKSAVVFGRADVEFHARYEIIQAFSTTCDFLS